MANYYIEPSITGLKAEILTLAKSYRNQLIEMEAKYEHLKEKHETEKRDRARDEVSLKEQEAANLKLKNEILRLDKVIEDQQTCNENQNNKLGSYSSKLAVAEAQVNAYEENERESVQTHMDLLAKYAIALEALIGTTDIELAQVSYADNADFSFKGRSNDGGNGQFTKNDLTGNMPSFINYGCKIGDERIDAEESARDLQEMGS